MSTRAFESKPGMRMWPYCEIIKEIIVQIRYAFSQIESRLLS